MNFGTMGTLEILAIAVIGFVILGPKGLINAARNVGATLGHIRKVTQDISQLATLELEDKDDSDENIEQNLTSNKPKQD